MDHTNLSTTSNTNHTIEVVWTNVQCLTHKKAAVNHHSMDIMIYKNAQEEINMLTINRPSITASTWLEGDTSSNDCMHTYMHHDR